MKFIIIRHKNEDEIRESVLNSMPEEMTKRIIQERHSIFLPDRKHDWGAIIQQLMTKRKIKRYGGNYSVFVRHHGNEMGREIWFGEVEKPFFDDVGCGR